MRRSSAPRVALLDDRRKLGLADDRENNIADAPDGSSIEALAISTSNRSLTETRALIPPPITKIWLHTIVRQSLRISSETIKRLNEEK
jgi:hypothetical protein